ncbi:uncharacterized protein YALI1_F27798g [Yarrowia lipolytica]|uniref:Uncharacterized protein n=1 Tax=Yarrowia lipolytica TaxID=4952 RepID=A0A1D8NPG6_YARLL|nr:hypothetical protein YALI1_F27798g [Yarrowia lipolytica]
MYFSLLHLRSMIEQRFLPKARFNEHCFLFRLKSFSALNFHCWRVGGRKGRDDLGTRPNSEGCVRQRCRLNNRGE